MTGLGVDVLALALAVSSWLWGHWVGKHHGRREGLREASTAPLTPKLLPAVRQDLQTFVGLDFQSASAIGSEKDASPLTAIWLAQSCSRAILESDRRIQSQPERT